MPRGELTRPLWLLLALVLILAGGLTVGGRLQSPVAAENLPPAIAIGPVSGLFFANPEDSGAIVFGAETEPVFVRSFPVIDFNPPPAAIGCSNPTGVDEDTRPMTDVVKAPDATCTTIVAEGNGYQAGVGELYSFQAAFLGTFTVSGPGDVTLNVFSDDGWVLGIAPSGGHQPTYVSGALDGVPAQTPRLGYLTVGGYDYPSSPAQRDVTVRFPAAGTYAFEFDYAECCGAQLVFTVNASGQVIPQAPTPTSTATITTVPTETPTPALTATPTATPSPAPPNVLIGPVVGNFFRNPEDRGEIVFDAQTEPVFVQDFPVIAFNPPPAAIGCTNPTGVDVGTRPFTDVVKAPDGSCATIVAEGSGYQAGVGELHSFQAAFLGTFIVSGPGDVTFNLFSDDGWVLGIGPSGEHQPTYVSGALDGVPPQTPRLGLPTVGGFNNPSSPAQRDVTVRFPAAGTYAFELDYAECWGGDLALTLNASGQVIAQAPTPTATATHTPTATATPTPTATDTPTSTATPLANLRIAPASSRALPGTTTSVDVEIVGVAGLGGFEFTLSFDPDLVSVEDITLGGFPGSSGRTFVPLGPAIDDEAGTARFGAFSLGRTPPGASGTGVLAQVTLQTRAVGTAALRLSRARVGDVAGRPIPVTTQDGTLVVLECFGDFDRDWDVDILDVQAVAYRWHAQVGDELYDPLYDLDGSGEIDIYDIQTEAYYWGTICGEPAPVRASAAPSPASLVLRPARRSLQVGQSVEVTVGVAGAADLGAFELTLAYDARRLEVVGVRPGGFLARTGREVVPVGPTSAGDGKLTLGSYSLGRQPAGPSGDGALAVVTLRARAAGRADLAVARALLADVAGRPQSVDRLGSGQLIILR